MTCIKPLFLNQKEIKTSVNNVTFVLYNDNYQKKKFTFFTMKNNLFAD